MINFRFCPYKTKVYPNLTEMPNSWKISPYILRIFAKVQIHARFARKWASCEIIRLSLW